ncbi:hypothetical protein LOTGIDRAFT_233902 [Lottia gigantea]|uniref:BZIP domain-containing protein n=1 Tax=Lottia gigantea TaxID=225164 RepID=V4A0A8_LOTGI|nr:hypothetical protein LOTGIDRAFT_233902 [Lottia gigantea]ESO90092.1 hypothetical protein LOTGIDRAFT_233902 [Lottia gigantea]
MTAMCDFSDLLDDDCFTMTNNNTMSQNNQEENDVLSAAQLSLQTGSVMPILKQELRYSILVRRNSEGKSEVDTQPILNTSNELSEYEIEKKKRRREQNRKAAWRFRQKNRSKSSQLETDIQALVKENDKLRKIQNDLIIERDNLLDKMKEHFQICNFRPVGLQCDLNLLFSRH